MARVLRQSAPRRLREVKKLPSKDEGNQKKAHDGSLLNCYFTVTPSDDVRSICQYRSLLRGRRAKFEGRTEAPTASPGFSFHCTSNPLLAWVVPVGLIVALVLYLNRRNTKSVQAERALDILERAYAWGEIKCEKFLTKRNDPSGKGDAPS